MSCAILTVEAPASVVQNPHNRKYCEVEPIQSPLGDSRSSTPPLLQFPPKSLLRITTDDTPKNPHEGFVFGSDTDTCDVVIPKDSATNISAKQFTITFLVETGAIILKNLCRQGTVLDIPDVEFTRLQSQRVLFDEPFIVKLGGIEIIISRSKIPDDSLNEYTAFLSQLTRSPQSVLTMKTTGAPCCHGYRIREILGNGKFATVHRAIDRYNRDVVAIKSYTAVSTSSWREATLLRSLDHENISIFLDFILTAKGGAQLVMEYAPSGSLSDQRRLRSFTEQKGRSITTQILMALNYLHNKSITHRNIRPSNILVFSREPILVKLADFGVSGRADEEHTRYCRNIYSAPEIYTCPYNEKMDIWSLGVIALELFAGMPHEAEGWESNGEWAVEIVAYKKTASGNIQGFLDYLLQLAPESRATAAECLESPFLELHSDGRPGTGSGDAKSAADEQLSETDSSDQVLRQNEQFVPTQHTNYRGLHSYSPGDKDKGKAKAALGDPYQQQTARLDVDMADYETISTEVLPAVEGVIQNSTDSPGGGVSVLVDTLPRSSKTYIDFFLWRGKWVAHNRGSKMVNITQLLQAAGFRQAVFHRPSVQALITEKQLEHGNADDGTYIAWKEAMDICKLLKINTKALPRFIRQAGSTAPLATQRRPNTALRK